MLRRCLSVLFFVATNLYLGFLLLPESKAQNTPPAPPVAYTFPENTQKTILCLQRAFAPIRTVNRFQSLPSALKAIVAVDVPNAANAGIVDIQTPELQQYKQVLAISDVHGQYCQVWHLLLASGVIQMIATPEIQDGKPTGALTWSADWKGSGTLLIVTGDSIDKGPQSLEVLTLWRSLQQRQKNQNRIVVLLGNHEAEYLAAPSRVKARRVHEELIGQGYSPEALADSHFVTHEGYRLGAFLRDMPLAARVGRWLFCHAGWLPDPAALNPVQTTAAGRWAAFVKAGSTVLRDGHYASLVSTSDEERDAPAGPLVSLLDKKTDSKGRKWWKREIPVLEARLEEYGLYGVVFGHQPKAFGLEDNVGISSPQDYHLVKIDSGMAVPNAPKEEDVGVLSDWPQPYMGHLLLFPNPSELAQGQHPPLMQSLGFSTTLIRTSPAVPQK